MYSYEDIKVIIMIDLMKKRFQILNLQKLEILEYFRIYI